MLHYNLQEMIDPNNLTIQRSKGLRNTFSYRRVMKKANILIFVIILHIGRDNIILADWMLITCLDQRKILHI